MPKAEAFRFFRILANLDRETVKAETLRHDSHLDFYMAGSDMWEQFGWPVEDYFTGEAQQEAAATAGSRS